MYSYGSLFAQTVQAQNTLLEGLARKGCIDGRRASILCLAREGEPEPQLFIPEGSTLNVVSCGSGPMTPLSKEQAFQIWRAYDAAQQKGNMLFVCSNESELTANSVARSFFKTHFSTPVIYDDICQVDKAIMQMMCDVRYLDQRGLWPPEDAVKKVPLTPDGLRMILAGPGAWWRIFLVEEESEKGIFKYMIRTRAADVVDISDSNTHCGTRHSITEFGDTLHAIVVPQVPIRACSQIQQS